MSRGLSAFIGRERELELLDRRLTEARSKLQVVDLEAEPGMGKSRLLHEFRQRLRHGPHIYFIGKLLARQPTVTIPSLSLK